MSLSTDSQVLTLRHEPYGEQHPYEPLPFERSPRDPSAGEEVKLGILTSRQPAAAQVCCVWKIDGDPATYKKEAQKIASNEESDTWQVQLPAFKSGSKVSYRLYAKNEKDSVESPEFSFFVNYWVKTEKLTSLKHTETALELNFATEKPGLGFTLQAEKDTKTENLYLKLFLSSQTEENLQPPAENGLITRQWEDICLRVIPRSAAFVFQRAGLELKSSAPIEALINEKGEILQYRITFESPQDEAFYGFGERFNAFNQRGVKLDNRVYGQYTNQGKRTYIPVPYFVSSRGYGLWLKTDCQAWFDLAAADSESWYLQGEAEGPSAELNLVLFLQSDPRGIVQAFTDQTGKPKLPPNWTFGLWMSANDWNSQSEVLRQLNLTRQHKIPASVLVIEAWSDEINFYIWNDAQYELKPSDHFLKLEDYTFPAEGRWPDPKAMLDELHAKGVRLVLWQNPTIKQNGPHESFDERLNLIDQAYAIEKDYVIKKADGSPHRVEKHMPWFGNSLVFDFTNPEAADWWFKKREYLVNEMGVDGFKTDGAEHVWDIHTLFHKGVGGNRGINRHPLDYESAYRRFMQSFVGDEHVLFSRAGYTGGQLNPCHWTGDENSTWEAFRATLNAMLNAGYCGYSFLGWDIAGFAGPLPSAELYKRATAFSVFCPIMQYHSDVNHRRKPSRDRTPWNMQEQTADESILPLFRYFTNLRLNLLPYILSQALESSQSGLPLMRALPLEYPADENARRSSEKNHEYLFGNALLVAPLTEEGSTEVEVYLPQGEWRDFWTGEKHFGPKTFKMQVPFDRLPVFQRQGSLLPLNLGESAELGSPLGFDLDTIGRLVWRIIPGEGFNSQVVLPGSKEALPVSISAHEILLPALSYDLDLEVFCSRPERVRLGEEEIAWDWEADRQVLKIHLPASDSDSRILLK